MNDWSNSNSDPIEDINAAIEAVKQTGYRGIYISSQYYDALIKYCNEPCSLAYFMHNIIGD